MRAGAVGNPAPRDCVARRLLAVVVVVSSVLGIAPSLTAQELTPPPTRGRRILPTETETETDTLATALSAPRPGVRAPRQVAPEQEPEEPWTGPSVELGYTHYNLYDGFEGGDVHAGTFGGHLPFGPIRISAWAELGTRRYSLANDDLIVRANILAGYQYLGWLPFAPYAGATVTLGVALGQRFGSPETFGFGGGGIEAGADLVIVRNLWFGASFGYQRVAMAGSGFDLWVFRLRLGL